MLIGALRTCATVPAEAGLLAFRDPADVGLADVGVHLHLRQVLGDHEEGRRLEAGGDGLTGIDVAGHHDAVDRGIDRGIAEIEFDRGQRGHRLIHLRLRDLDLGLGVAEVCGGQVEIRL
jgi:hypothetical protein